MTYEEAHGKAIEALEKQIAKKPKIVAEGLLPYCPECGSVIHNWCCSYCGQRIDRRKI